MVGVSDRGVLPLFKNNFRFNIAGNTTEGFWELDPLNRKIKKYNTKSCEIFILHYIIYFQIHRHVHKLRGEVVIN